MSQQGQWQLAGSAPDVYERELVPAVFGPWAPIVVELAHPRLGERAVDIACGTGLVARIAAARVGPSGSVAGVDLNPGMLNDARSVAPSEPSAPIHWHEASADKLIARSISPIASWVYSSSPIGRRPYAKCTGFLLPKEDLH